MTASLTPEERAVMDLAVEVRLLRRETERLREALEHAVRSALVRSGFAPHGHDGWIRDDEGCGTVYDTLWALERAELPNLARKYRAALAVPASTEEQE